MQMVQMCKLFLCAFISAGLAACATPTFDADAVRFHTFSPDYAPNGARVAILPGSAQQESLEFATYAEVVGADLGALGFTPAQDGQADFIAEVTTDVRQSKRKEVDQSPVNVGVGVGGVGRNVGVGVGTSIGVGKKNPRETYIKELQIRMLEADGNKVVYEARASTEQDSPSMADAISYLSDAIFAQFPGPSGQSTRYSVPLE